MKNQAGLWRDLQALPSQQFGLFAHHWKHWNVTATRVFAFSARNRILSPSGSSHEQRIEFHPASGSAPVCWRQ